MIRAGGANFADSKEFPHLHIDQPWYVKVRQFFNTPKKQALGVLAVLLVFLMLTSGSSPSKTSKSDKKPSEIYGNWEWTKPDVSLPTDTSRWKETLINLSEVPQPQTENSYMASNQESFLYWRYIDNTEDVDVEAAQYAKNLDPEKDKVFIGPMNFQEHESEFATQMKSTVVEFMTNIIQGRVTEDTPEEDLAVLSGEFTISVKDAFVSVHRKPINRKWHRVRDTEFIILYYAQVPDEDASPSIRIFDTPVSTSRYSLVLPLREPGLLIALPAFTRYKHSMETSTDKPLIVFTFRMHVEYIEDARYEMLQRVMPDLKSVGFESDKTSNFQSLQEQEDELEDGEQLDGLLYYQIPVLQMSTFHRRISIENEVDEKTLKKLSSPSSDVTCKDSNVTGVTTPLILEFKGSQLLRQLDEVGDLENALVPQEEIQNSISMEVLLSDVVQLPAEEKVVLTETRCVTKLKSSSLASSIENSLTKDFSVGIDEMATMLSTMAPYSRTFARSVRPTLYENAQNRVFKPVVEMLQHIHIHSTKLKAVDGLSTIKYPVKYGKSSPRRWNCRNGVKMYGVYFPKTTSRAVCTIGLRNRHHYLMKDAKIFDETFLRMRRGFGATTISGEPGTYVLFPGYGRFGLRDNLAVGHAGMMHNGKSDGCRFVLLEVCVHISDAVEETKEIEEEEINEDAEHGLAANAEEVEKENKAAELEDAAGSTTPPLP